MSFYRAYHVDAAGKTVSHVNFTALNDHVACVEALLQKDEGVWHTLELWMDHREVPCPEIENEERGGSWGTRIH